jgi:hypothetical protein
VFTLNCFVLIIIISQTCSKKYELFDLHEQYICKEDQFHLNCENNEIEIKNVFFGRKDTKKICNSNPCIDTFNDCGLEKSDEYNTMTQSFYKECNGQKMCDFKFKSNKDNSAHFFIKITYKCIFPFKEVYNKLDFGGTARVYACQDQFFNLYCPKGLIIIRDIFYGRMNHETCHLKSLKVDGSSGKVCNNNNSESLSLVRKKCNGESTCYLRVDKDNFGEPCFLVYKYAIITYTCQKRNFVFNYFHNFYRIGEYKKI